MRRATRGSAVTCATGDGAAVRAEGAPSDARAAAFQVGDVGRWADPALSGCPPAGSRASASTAGNGSGRAARALRTADDPAPVAPRWAAARSDARSTVAGSAAADRRRGAARSDAPSAAVCCTAGGAAERGAHPERTRLVAFAHDRASGARSSEDSGAAGSTCAIGGAMTYRAARPPREAGGSIRADARSTGAVIGLELSSTRAPAATLAYPIGASDVGVRPATPKARAAIRSLEANSAGATPGGAATARSVDPVSSVGGHTARSVDPVSSAGGHTAPTSRSAALWGWTARRTRRGASRSPPSATAGLSPRDATRSVHSRESTAAVGGAELLACWGTPGRGARCTSHDVGREDSRSGAVAPRSWATGPARPLTCWVRAADRTAATGGSRREEARRIPAGAMSEAAARRGGAAASCDAGARAGAGSSASATGEFASTGRRPRRLDPISIRPRATANGRTSLRCRSTPRSLSVQARCTGSTARSARRAAPSRARGAAMATASAARRSA